ncbi:MAG: hypothetical protein LBF89_03340 [Bacteroidales bacterium]|jgi:hypothetical protein|nr:hypothetical protein [Bacteroidales bacterium]
MTFFKNLFLPGIGWALSSALFAQDPNSLNKELILVRPYEPSVTNAQKINILPDLRDTVRIKPTFKYSIRSKRIDTHPDVTPIAAAKLQPLPQSKLYHSYVKLGIGTKFHPLAEASINTLRNDKLAAGALLKLDGMFDNVKLDNDQTVYAGASDAKAKLFVQKFYRSSYLYGDAALTGKTVHNYGYNTDVYNRQAGRDTLMAKDDIRKHYTFADASVGIHSSHFLTNRLNYNVQATYEYAGNKTDSHGDIVPIQPVIRKYKENNVGLKAQLDNNMFGGNIDLRYYAGNAAFDSLRNTFAMGVNPWFILDNDSIRLEVGMRVALYKENDGLLQYKVYPKVEFQFTLFKDVFIPFLGIDGALKTNTFRELIEENPFITPGLSVPLTNTKLNIYGGLKGSITSKLSYYLKASYTTSDNEHFFVNDTVWSKAQNHFTAVIDDLSTFSIGAEIYYNPNERLELRLKAKYNRYETLAEKFAWHLPEWETEFSAKYQYRKFLFFLDMLGIGKRYAKSFDPNIEYYTLKHALDFNFGVEFQYIKQLSFFLKLNNFTETNYYRWNFYPSQRFNLLGGITFSL